MMNNLHPYRAIILPVPVGTVRPLWSVMIPTYNCAHYLRETLASVLAQDPGPDVMQIEVIDDHSTQDDPQAVVEELGHGRVEFYRQPQNMGYIKNFETCLQRSRGKLVHLLHGDDWTLYGFYRRMQSAFEQNQEIGAAFCRHIFANEHGHWQNISRLEQQESGILENGLEKIIVNHPIQTPSVVVRREVYEKLGGFDCRFRGSCEDWEMWVRVAATYPIWYEVKPLAAYRMHSTSLTGNSLRTAENTRDSQRAIEIFQSYLSQYIPVVLAEKLIEMAKEHSANYAILLAQKLFNQGDVVSMNAQLREARKLSSSPKTTKKIFRLSFASKFYPIKQKLKAMMFNP